MVVWSSSDSLENLTAFSSTPFTIVAPTTGGLGLNVSQDSLASISDAIAKIVAEIQAMLNK